MVTSSCDVRFLGRRVAAGGVGSAARIVLLRSALAPEPPAARRGAQILGTCARSSSIFFVFVTKLKDDVLA